MEISFQQIIDCHPENKKYYEMLLNFICDGGISIPFIGAGMSKPIYPLWKEILRKIADEAGKGHRNEVDKYIENGQYEEAATYIQRIRGISRFYDDLSNEYSPNKLIISQYSEALRLVTLLWSGAIITTNYDKVLENLYESIGHPFQGCYMPRLPYDKVIVDRATKINKHYLIKLHGDIDNPRSCIITSNDYNQIYGEFEDDKVTDFVSLLRILYIQGSFLFLGCGLENDRTLKILSSVTSIGEFYNFAIVELPDQTKVDDPFCANIIDPLSGNHWSVLERKEIELSNLNIRLIWYPSGQHNAVAVILRQIIEDCARKGFIPNRNESTFVEFRHRHNLYGREKEVHDLYTNLQDMNKSLFIVCGAPGIGKTEICNEIANRINRDGWIVLPVMLQGKCGFESLLISIAKSLRIFKEDMIISRDKLVSILNNKCRNRKLLLYLDNFEDIFYTSDSSSNSLHRDEQTLSFISDCISIRNLKVLISSRETISGIDYYMGLKPLDNEAATSLFSDIWQSSGGNKSILDKEKNNLQDFISEKLDNHPLSIILVASQCQLINSINELEKLWDEEAGKISIDISNNRQQKSLAISISTSFKKIQDDECCCQIWGIFSLLQSNIELPILNEIFSNSSSLLMDSMLILKKLNLIYVDTESFGMLSPIKQRIFDYISPEKQGGEQNSINLLLNYYINKIDISTPGHIGWNQNHRSIIKQIDNILFLILYLFNHHYWSEMLQLHRSMYNLYQYRAQYSNEIINKIIENQGIINIDNGTLGFTFWIAGNIKHLLGAINEAKILYIDAEEIFLKNQNSLGVAHVLRSKGDLFFRMGLVKDARVEYSQAEKLYIQEKEILSLANLYKSMGELFARIGYLRKASDNFNKAEELFMNEQDHLGQAYILLNKGNLLIQFGEVDKAFHMYNQAEVLFIQEKDDLGLASVYSSKSELLIRLGSIEEAGKLLDQAEILLRRCGSGVPNILLSKGRLKSLLNDDEVALNLYNQAEELFVQEQDNLGLANTFLDKGEMKVRQGLIDEALILFKKAEGLYKQEQSILSLANVLHSEGVLMFKKRSIGEALNLYTRSEELYKKEKCKMGLANVLNSKGELYLRTGQHTCAKESYEGALKIHREQYNYIGEAYSLGGLCVTFACLEQNEQAFRTINDIYSLFGKLPDRVKANLLWYIQLANIALSDSAE